MQKLQLYISGERIDLFKDEQVSFNQSIQNIKDPAKIFTEFTQTFTVPASATNNKIFKHYYNYNIVNSNDFNISGFDARNKVDANIELNNIDFKQGYIKEWEKENKEFIKELEKSENPFDKKVANAMANENVDMTIKKNKS